MSWAERVKQLQGQARTTGAFDRNRPPPSEGPPRYATPQPPAQKPAPQPPAMKPVNPPRVRPGPIFAEPGRPRPPSPTLPTPPRLPMRPGPGDLAGPGPVRQVEMPGRVGGMRDMEMRDMRYRGGPSMPRWSPPSWARQPMQPPVQQWMPPSWQRRPPQPPVQQLQRRQLERFNQRGMPAPSRANLLPQQQAGSFMQRLYGGRRGAPGGMPMPPMDRFRR